MVAWSLRVLSKAALTGSLKSVSSLASKGSGKVEIR